MPSRVASASRLARRLPSPTISTRRSRPASRPWRCAMATAPSRSGTRFSSSSRPTNSTVARSAGTGAAGTGSTGVGAAYRLRSIPQDTAVAWWRRPLSRSRATALGVGAVTARTSRYTEIRSRQAHRDAAVRSRSGMCTKPNRFSGMKWLVATTGRPRSTPTRASARPTRKCAWMWIRSGFNWASTRSTPRLACQGGQNRNVGWNGVRRAASRCRVTPSTRSVLAGPVVDGQITCTSCPRPARPNASRWAKRAAPLMSGGNVSAPMTIRSGRSPDTEDGLTGFSHRRKVRCRKTRCRTARCGTARCGW